MIIVVIGGGIAGASVAYELAERADVVVLEAEAVCGHHATGRSAALFTECYGDRVVRRLARAGRRFIESPPDGFADAPLVTPLPLLMIGRAEQRDRLEHDLAEYGELVPSVRSVMPDEIVRLCPVVDTTVIVGGILEPDARSIDVHGLHLGYQRAARGRGAVVRTGAGVVGLDRIGSGWRVGLAGETIDADVVVNAAGAWADEIGALAGAEPIGLAPLRRTAFTFRPPEGTEPRAWPMVLDVEERFYFRPEGARLLGSPADETPMEPCDVRHDEADVALGIERITAATTMTIRTVGHAWAGLRSFVADRRPVNGWDPVMPGLYWLAGQGGFGIKTAPGMARFAAGMILDGAPPPDLVAAGITVDDLGLERLRAVADGR
jgi:D-arginine dehydrogenase